MSAAEILTELERLPLAERLDLVHALWDSIVDDAPERLPLSEAHRELLRERLDAARNDPGAGRPWREALDELEREL